MLTVQLAQDEIMIRKRSFLILVLPVSLRTRFPCLDFHGQTSLIRTTIMVEHGVGFSSSIIRNNLIFFFFLGRKNKTIMFDDIKFQMFSLFINKF